MSAEERLIEACEDEETDMEPDDFTDYRARRHERFQKKNKDILESFLGDVKTVNSVILLPRYYGDLLTWALQRHIEKERWKVVRALGYRSPAPVYTDVFTGCDSSENLLMNGQLLLEKKDCHFVVTVDINPRSGSSLMVEGRIGKKKDVCRFADEINTIVREQNFYRGKKLEFSGRLRFLNLTDRAWDSIILDNGIKKDIKANTVDFINRREILSCYGIPPKRGVLIIGEPGTGKTAICKALMAEASGITCITANPYMIDAEEYITELYDIAQDLCPCIVFIEDIDLIAQDRVEFGYPRGSALLSLLAVLDGVEEKKEIITVATSNYLEKLDKAISRRPSRFDRVIELSLPGLEQRRQIISLLCRKIPLDEASQLYIAQKADGCTPAQLQEIIYSLVIEHDDGKQDGPDAYIKASAPEINKIIAKIKDRKGHHIGFLISASLNGHKMDRTGIIEMAQE